MFEPHTDYSAEQIEAWKKNYQLPRVDPFATLRRQQAQRDEQRERYDALVAEVREYQAAVKSFREDQKSGHLKGAAARQRHMAVEAMGRALAGKLEGMG